MLDQLLMRAEQLLQMSPAQLLLCPEELLAGLQTADLLMLSPQLLLAGFVWLMARSKQVQAYSAQLLLWPE